MNVPAVDYAAVFQALPGAVALVTPQLIYADANAEFLRLRGVVREQVVGRFVPEDHPEKTGCRWRHPCRSWNRC